MEAKIIEKLVNLCDLTAGQMAVSVNREQIFICAHSYNKQTSENQEVIIEPTNLTDQYTDKRDMNQRVKLMTSQDRFYVDG